MDSNSNYGNNGKKKTGLIIGIIVGVLFFVLLDIILFAKIMNRNDSSSTSSKFGEKRTETERKKDSSKGKRRTGLFLRMQRWMQHYQIVVIGMTFFRLKLASL